MLVGLTLFVMNGCTMSQATQPSTSDTGNHAITDKLVPYDVLSDGTAIFLKGDFSHYSYCFFDADGNLAFELPSQYEEINPVMSDIADGVVIVRYVSDDEYDVGLNSRYGLVDLKGGMLVEPSYIQLVVEPSGLYLIGLCLTSENNIQVDLFNLQGKLEDSYRSPMRIQGAELFLESMNPYNCSVIVTGEIGNAGTDYCEIIYYEGGKLKGGQNFPKGTFFSPQGRDFGEVIAGGETLYYQKYDGTLLNALDGVCSRSGSLGDANSVIAVFKEGTDCQIVSQEGQIIEKIEGTAEASEIVCAGDYVFAIYLDQNNARAKAFSQDGILVKELPLIVSADIAGGAYVAYEKGLYSVSNGDERRYYDSGLNEVENEPAAGFECGQLLDGRSLIMVSEKIDSFRHAPSGEVVDSSGNPVVIDEYTVSAQSHVLDWQLQGVVQRDEDDICAKDTSGKFGAINTYGEVVIPFDFDDLHIGGKGSNCLVKQGDAWYVFDVQAQTIRNPQARIHVD